MIKKFDTVAGKILIEGEVMATIKKVKKKLDAIWKDLDKVDDETLKDAAGDFIEVLNDRIENGY